MNPSAAYCLVLSTCSDTQTAEGIARELVSQQLAACVNIIDNVRSVYRWQDELQSDAEVLMLIKTSTKLLEKLEHQLLELHPYELPEIISVPIESAAKPYLNWLSGNLTSS